jgi:hypothetical protein
MLTLQEYMLSHLVEECSELQKAAVKIQRFGTDHFWAKEGQINIDALIEEANDVLYMLRAMRLAGFDVPEFEVGSVIKDRRGKFAEMLAYSRKLGRVHGEFDCRVCGKNCPITDADPRVGAVCEEHCPDHMYSTDSGDTRCIHCFKLAPDDYHEDDQIPF